jgi:hypothetical protein
MQLSLLPNGRTLKAPTYAAAFSPALFDPERETPAQSLVATCIVLGSIIPSTRLRSCSAVSSPHVPTRITRSPRMRRLAAFFRIPAELNTNGPEGFSKPQTFETNIVICLDPVGTLFRWEQQLHPPLFLLSITYFISTKGSW